MRALRSTAIAGGLLACATAAWAVFGPGPNSVTVPSTGQTLSATITAPPDNSQIPIPPGTALVQGNCAITPAVGSCNQGTVVNVVYVLDVSGSTDLNYMQQNGIPLVDADGNGVAGNAGDDLNGDGEAGDILDGEIAGVLALHASIGNPANVNVGVVAFATAARAADMDPALPNTGGVSQVYTFPPQADRDGLNGGDVAEVLRSIDSNFNTPSGGQIAKFTLVPRSTLGSSTDFKDALGAANGALALFPAGKNVVFFLSDGQSNDNRCVAGDCVPELAAANAACTTVNTVAVGAGADPVDLAYIATQTGGVFLQVTNPSQLATQLPLINPSGLAPNAIVNGSPVALDALGNFSYPVACVDTNPFTVTATCRASDPASTSVSADVTLSCFFLCGNGVVNGGVGEECEPPNTVTCDSLCQRVPLCGDGFIDAPETCDPPNGTTCDVDCTPIACGNGQVEPGEECEPPSTPTCDAACQRVPVCGDGFVDGGEQCDPPNGTTCTPTCTAVSCGDGQVDPPEECEPPSTSQCDAVCQRIPRCGDGFTDAPETCDPPDGTTCNAACRAIVCGDGTVEGGEQCDPPNGVAPPATCDFSCQNIPCLDADNDGVCDLADNCPAVPNPGQADADGDGIGNACDLCTDTDGDGYGDPGFPANTCALDNCPEEPNPDQEDYDQDGHGDVCDPIDDPINIFQANVRSSPSLSVGKGKILVKGDFVIGLQPGELVQDRFNAETPITVQVHDSRFLDEVFGFLPAECQLRFKPLRTGGSELRQIKCRTADKRAKGSFNVLGKNRNAIRFKVSIAKVMILGPFQQDLTVRITNGLGGAFNREGVIHDCEASSGSGLRCRE